MAVVINFIVYTSYMAMYICINVINSHLLIDSIVTGHASHRFSGGDSPPPELPSSPPPPIGFTGRESIDNDPVVSDCMLLLLLLLYGGPVITVKYIGLMYMV